MYDKIKTKVLRNIDYSQNYEIRENEDVILECCSKTLNASFISHGSFVSSEAHASPDLTFTHENEGYNASTSCKFPNPKDLLKNIKKDNLNRLIIAQININSLRNKFDSLNTIINGNVDILVVNETKLDSSFPNQQFAMEGFSLPYRMDISSNQGGTLIYVRDDIPCRRLNTHSINNNLEGIFLEVNLRKTKWLVFGGYNNNTRNIKHFLQNLGPILDHYMPKFDNILLLGDFNSELVETDMSEFCDIFNLKNLVKSPTCFKNPLNPSCIDLMLTNRHRSFQYSQTIETGLSDHHRMTVTVLKSFFQKQPRISIKYRDYKYMDKALFQMGLKDKLNYMAATEMTYEIFESIFMEELDKHAPMKEKYVRANNAPFMTKVLSKAIMNRSRLRNKYLKTPTITNKNNYNKQRNYCVNLLRRVKKEYYNNLDEKTITDNKLFWKTITPFFSDKIKVDKKIMLIDGDDIISDDADIAEVMNEYFSNIVSDLGIKEYESNTNCILEDNSIISNIIEKFNDHPSILKIRENVTITNRFQFLLSQVSDMKSIIMDLNTKKPTTFNNIPAKVIVETSDICSSFISKIYNDSIFNCNFPQLLKMADITPVYKKEERTKIDNYRPVSILPTVSKIFERNMSDQISAYIKTYLSDYLCGFRKGYSTQHCLMFMLEKWRKALDIRHVAGALLTDLSKAFDCINHELLIAKLDAYGFDTLSLSFIYSYLSDRKQRTKIKNAFSSWSEIKSGIPQGSILGPLLFNIYLNDIFYFTKEYNLTNYADDNTPYTTDSKVEEVLNVLTNETSILTKWFSNNFFKMNADKCHLLVTNHDADVSVNIDGEIIKGSKSVKLLGLCIDNKLDFNEHISKICKKVSLKLHALSRISPYLNTKRLRIIMKAFIESQFSYCPLIWMFHSRTLNNRINRLHERALRLVYKNSISTFEELLEKDNSFTVHHRNLQKLVTEIYKVKHSLSPPFMKEIFSDSINPYNLRTNPEFKNSNIHTVSNGSETIAFRGPKTWALVPDYIKNSKSLNEFKSQIRTWKPVGCMCRLCKIYIANVGFI